MSLTILPTAGQSLNVTRDPIRNNFSLIQNAFIVDHVDFNIVNQGMHNQVTLPTHTGAAPAGANIILTNQLLAAVGELYIHKTYHAGTHDIPATKSTISTTARAIGELAYTYLPSGIILQWGTWNTAVSTSTVTLPIAFPNSLLNVQLTPYVPGAGMTNMLVLWSSAVPANPLQQFIVGTTVNGVAADTTFSFLAIGY